MKKGVLNKKKQKALKLILGPSVKNGLFFQFIFNDNFSLYVQG